MAFWDGWFGGGDADTGGAADFKLFTTAEDFIDQALSTAAQQLPASDLGMVINAIAAATTVWIMYRGYETLAGKTSDPINDVLWKLGGVALIMVFMQGEWHAWAMSLIDNLRVGIAGERSGMSALDSFVSDMNVFGDDLYNKTESFQPIWIMPMFWVGMLLCCISFFVTLLMNTVVMKLLTYTAPLFFACLCFGWLKGMFEKWVAAVMSSILLLLFMNLLTGMVLAFGKMMLSGEIDSVNMAAVSVLALGFLSSSIASMAVSLSTNLASISIESAKEAAAAQGLTQRAGGAVAGAAAAKASGGASLLARAAINKIKGSPKPA